MKPILWSTCALAILVAVPLAACDAEGELVAATTGVTATATTGVTTIATTGVTAAAATAIATTAATTGWTWKNAPFGAGGYISGILYHPAVSGLVYVRTDVGGVYRRDSATAAWVPLNDDMGRDDAQLGGILSMAVDPNDIQKLYLAAGSYTQSWGRTAAILRSGDRGATWSRTELPIRLGGNNDGRGTGERLQVDPNKGSILFLGTNQDGLYKSTDSGVTWAKVSGFAPASTTFVLPVKASGTTGNATPVIYAGVATTSGSSLYRSTDGGASWAAVPGQPSGFMPLQGAIDANGNLYLSYANALGPNGATTGAVYKLQTPSGTWTNVTPSAPASSQPFGYGGVTVDLKNPGTVMVSTLDRWGAGDDVYRSTDSGLSWAGLNSRSSHAAASNPWLAAAQGGSLAGKMGHWITDVDIDPFDGNNVMYNTGYGLWESRNARTTGTIAWNFNVAGIEETVPTATVSTTTGQSSTDVAHLFASMGDTAGAHWATLAASDTGGYFSDPNVSNISVDVAEKVPAKVVRTARTSFGGYMSGDNGVTWTRFGGTPVASGNDVGNVAISAGATTMLWVPQNQGAYRSTDGTTWHASSGYPVVSGQYLAPVADRAVDAFYYSYDYTTGRLFESGDGGWSFSAVLSGLPTNAGSYMVSVPGTVRRDLWIATTAGLYHIDGPTASPVKLSSVTEAYAIGYGAPASGASYWSLYLWGKVSGVVGLYQSNDKGVSWTRINDAAHQFMYINTLSGDPRVYGKIYLGTSGRGVIVGTTGS